MKRKNKKLTTLMLASALCAATIGGVAFATPVSASAEVTEGMYALSDVFSVKSAEIKPEENKTAFSFSDNGAVTFRRDLAFKWYEDKNNAKYLSMQFAFKDVNFSSVSFVVESASAWATEEEKASNTVKFTNDNGAIFASVLNGTVEGEKKEVAVVAGQAFTLSLKVGEADGEFGVALAVADGETIDLGSFTNVGANFAEYTYEKMYPLVINADMPDDAAEDKKNTVLYLTEINGQKFDNVTTEDNKAYVTDTAAPVLVVNEEVNGFLLGTQFALDYEKVDVLQSSNLKDSKEYYQYNPTDEEKEYKELTTSIYFMDTAYEKDGVKTSVFEQEGKEYVSIKITLEDKVFKEEEGDNAKKTIDLSWYANNKETIDGVDYILLDRNTAGAEYSHLVANDETKTNDKKNQTEFNASYEAFQKALTTAAKDVYAGSNSSIYLPSVKWLINDNNGYRNLKFTISYKKPTSSSASTSSSLSYNGLKISVTDEGQYEFKIFAVDKANNTMKYYLDGELVSVTSSNVWDIEEIPTFKFEIKNQGLKLDLDKNGASETESSKKETEHVGEKYTLSDFTIVGATTLKKDYALYKINEEKAKAVNLKASDLTKVKYSELREKLVANKAWETLKDDYFDAYLTAYAELLAAQLKVEDVQKVKDCFESIDEFDSRIDEEKHPEQWKNSDNKYNWTAASKSFTAVEEGSYVILADYSESELPLQRAAAYKVVLVETEVDKTKGETASWVEKNIVSVILFAVAGVMLILIIILLLVKPSDETLEDVDAKAAKKAEKDKKQNEEEK